MNRMLIWNVGEDEILQLCSLLVPGPGCILMMKTNVQETETKISPMPVMLYYCNGVTSQSLLYANPTLSNLVKREAQVNF